MSDKNLFETLKEMIDGGTVPNDRADEIWRRYGQQVAVLILDSSGFSRVSQQLGIIHFLERLVIMRDIVAPVFAAHDYLEYHFEADNVYAAFNSADTAVKVADASQHAINNSNLMLTEEEPFRICIGIGYGRMLYSETLEGYFGEEMNLASKLGEDTADPGEILITSSTYEHANEELQAGFEARTLDIPGLTGQYYAKSTL